MRSYSLCNLINNRSIVPRQLPHELLRCGKQIVGKIIMYRVDGRTVFTCAQFKHSAQGLLGIIAKVIRSTVRVGCLSICHTQPFGGGSNTSGGLRMVGRFGELITITDTPGQTVSFCQLLSQLLQFCLQRIHFPLVLTTNGQKQFTPAGLRSKGRLTNIHLNHGTENLSLPTLGR